MSILIGKKTKYNINIILIIIYKCLGPTILDPENECDYQSVILEALNTGHRKVIMV